jgi:hypothetical protein
MGAKTDGNDAIHLLRDAVIAVIDMADDADSDQVKLAMDILLAGTSQLGTIFQRRCAQLANQKQPRAAKPPKPAPQKSPQTQKPKPSSTDTQNTKNDIEDRSKAVSSIQQGIRQAEPTLADQQQALRGYVYGAQNDEVAFRKAAQAITR